MPRTNTKADLARQTRMDIVLYEIIQRLIQQRLLLVLSIALPNTISHMNGCEINSVELVKLSFIL